MKERVGRVAENKGKRVKGKNTLQGRYPGGKHMKSDKTMTWLEETSLGSSNHPVQAPHETLSTSKVGPESNPLLGAVLLGMVVSGGDEECSSST